MTGTIFATVSKYFEIGDLIANATPSAKNTPKTPNTPKSKKTPNTPKEPRIKNVHYSTLQNKEIALSSIRKMQSKVMLHVETGRYFNFSTTDNQTEQEIGELERQKNRCIQLETKTASTVTEVA